MVDSDRFEAYLTEQLKLSKRASVVAIQPISGGYNSSMTRVSVDTDGVVRDFTVRSDLPPDRTLVAVDRHSEWAVLNAVFDDTDGASCPPLVGFDSDGSHLGEPSLVLEYVEGAPLQALATATPREERMPLAERMFTTASQIHQRDLSRLSGRVERPSNWSDYIASQIQHWRDAEAEYIEPDPFMRFTASWLEHHQPPEAPLGLVHGDFQASNVLLDDSGKPTVVDWEFAHIGDPREDLGWLQVMEQLSPPVLYGIDPTAACEYYRRHMGLDEDVVNPDAVAYFAILALGRPIRAVMQQTASFVDGKNRSLVMPYARAALAASRLQALSDMRRLTSSPFLVHGGRT